MEPAPRSSTPRPSTPPARRPRSGLRDQPRAPSRISRRASRVWSPTAGSGSTPSRPGPIWTPLIPSTMPPEKVETFGKNTPLKRPGQPAELAATYVCSRRTDRATRPARSTSHRRKTDALTARPASGLRQLRPSRLRSTVRKMRGHRIAGRLRIACQEGVRAPPGAPRNSGAAAPRRTSASSSRTTGPGCAECASGCAAPGGTRFGSRRRCDGGTRRPSVRNPACSRCTGRLMASRTA